MARNLGVADRTRGARGSSWSNSCVCPGVVLRFGRVSAQPPHFQSFARRRLRARRQLVEEWGRRTAGRGVAMAETALSHGTIMHIHELQALGAEAVGKSVRVLGA